MFWLFADVHHFRDRHLHAERQFVTQDARVEFLQRPGEPWLALVAGLVLSLLMSGAVLMHVKIRDPLLKSVPAAFFLALNAYFLEQQRLQVPGDRVLAGAGLLGLGAITGAGGAIVVEGGAAGSADIR